LTFQKTQTPERDSNELSATTKQETQGNMQIPWGKPNNILQVKPENRTSRSHGKGKFPTRSREKTTVGKVNEKALWVSKDL
jgi:hypothetical protein